MIGKWLVIGFLLCLSTLLNAAPSVGVLFVPGSFSDVDPRQVGQTFAVQKDFLDRAGIPWRELRTYASRPYSESVPLLIGALRDSAWDRNLIVTHSVGGLIALSALTGRPALHPRVKGWIAYQSPFYGARVVDRTTDALDFWDPLRLRRFFYGRSGNAILATSRAERWAWMENHQREVRRLTSAIPVVCVTADLGGGDDGLVETDSMLLPGATEIRVDGAGHLDLTVGEASSSYQSAFEDSLRALER